MVNGTSARHPFGIECFGKRDKARYHIRILNLLATQCYVWIWLMAPQSDTLISNHIKLNGTPLTGTNEANCISKMTNYSSNRH